MFFLKLIVVCVALWYIVPPVLRVLYYVVLGASYVVAAVLTVVLVVFVLAIIALVGYIYWKIMHAFGFGWLGITLLTPVILIAVAVVVAIVAAAAFPGYSSRSSEMPRTIGGAPDMSKIYSSDWLLGSSSDVPRTIGGAPDMSRIYRADRLSRRRR